MIRHSRLVKHLMLGLVYPAVLGTVMYGALDAVLGPVVAGLIGRSPVFEVDHHIVSRTTYLVIAVAFYLADYLYILFTKTYRLFFAACSIVFLFTLYTTVYAIGFNSGEMPPNLPAMVVCYSIFMTLYLAWDVVELRAAEGDERAWYKRVVRWELASLAALAGCWFLPTTVLAVVLPWVLGVITMWFARFSLQKRRFAPEWRS